jgi:predicted phosphodiesterase
MPNLNMSYKRIGVLGDIHTEHVYLEQSLNFLKKENVEQTFSVGDIVDGFGDVNRSCELLREHNVLTVRGNHERWLLTNQMRILSDANSLSDLKPESLDWLRGLPVTLTFGTTTGDTLVCHGLAEDDMGRLMPDDMGYALESNTSLETVLYESQVRYVINGHTHWRMIRKIDNITFINAGTLKKRQNPGFAIIDFVYQQVHFYDVGPLGISPLAPIALP